MTATVADLLALSIDAGLPARPSDAGAEPYDVPAHLTLIAAARAGSREAFGELVALHQRVVFRATLAALGTREDAEDAAQDAFIVAWQKLPGFRGDASFRTWLLTIAWRKALDRRRARLLRWTRTPAPAFDAVADPIEAIPAATPSPEQAVVASELAQSVRREIARLTPRLRDTLLLAASGDYSYQEISDLLGVPLGTVKWRVSEARRLVAERMGARLSGPEGRSS